MSVSAVLKCLRSWLTGSHQSYTQFLTAVTVVHRASRPHLVTRFGEFGSLEETLSQRIEYVQSDGEDGLRLCPSPLEGHWDETTTCNSRRTTEMMDSTMAMAIGDAEGDWRAAEELLAESCTAYGLEGREKILQAKKENFSKNLPDSGVAYEVNNFLCDPDNRMVSFTFECFLQGQEGRGTEMVFFNEDGLIQHVQCVRHKI